MNYLVLTLEGVLQYYAAHNFSNISPSGSYFKTEKCPTVSAMVGILGAAFGYPQGDERLKELRKLSYKYITTHKGSIFKDFNTAGSEDKDYLDWCEYLGCKPYFSTIEGKTKGKDDNTLTKTVEYLQDYAFKVFVGADDKKLREIYEAMTNVRWEPYLGRQNCRILTSFIEKYTVVSDKELEEMKYVYDCP